MLCVFCMYTQCSLRRVPTNQPPQREQDTVHGWHITLGDQASKSGYKMMVWPLVGEHHTGTFAQDPDLSEERALPFLSHSSKEVAHWITLALRMALLPSVSLSSVWWVEAETVLALWYCGREMRPMYGDVRKALQTHSSSEFKCAFMSRTITV